MAFLLGAFLAVCGVVSLLASNLLAAHSLAGESPLTALYINGAIQSVFETGILLLISAAGFYVYALLPGVWTSFMSRASMAVNALPRSVRLALLFLACGVGTFLLNAGGI